MEYALLILIVIFNLVINVLEISEAKRVSYTQPVKLFGNKVSKHNAWISMVYILITFLINDSVIVFYGVIILCLTSIVCLTYINTKCYQKCKDRQVIKEIIYHCITYIVLVSIAAYFTYKI